MLEAGCHTDLRSHENTEHLVFLKTIFNKKNQELEKLVESGDYRTFMVAI